MTDASGKRGGRRVKAKAGGFTLVELMLVIFVLAVLVAMVVGVGSYVMQQGKKNETLGKMDRLLAGIRAYANVTGEVPPEDPNGSGDIQYLMDGLAGKRVSGDLKEELRREVMDYTGEHDDTLKYDAFGTRMLYFSARGLGGKPVLLSAGADTLFGDEGIRDRMADNIRSDTRDYHGAD